VNDAYAFTILSSLGKSTQIAYTNVANPGAALPAAATLTGTVAVTQGSTIVTFSVVQTLTAGTLVTFASQPGVSYTVLASTVASLTGTLTTAYQGTTAASTTTTVGITTLVTNGSANVTFAVAQTLAKGQLLTFASQPGVYYALSAIVTASTAGVLTAAYQGTTAAATNTTTLAPLAGTFNAVNLASIIPTTASQVGAVAVGDSVVFASQPGLSYTVFAVTAASITLSTPYTGVTNATVNATDVCQVSTAAAAIQYQLSALTGIGTVSVTGAVVSLSRTDGALTDIQGWLANGFSNLVLQDLTADPGIATDLAAMQAANNGAWYGLILDSNSQAEVQAAAAFCASTGNAGKFGFFNNSDAQNGVVATTTDVDSVLKGLTNTRVLLGQNNSQLLCYEGAALCGNALARYPGSYTMGYKNLPNVPADSDTTMPEGFAMALNTMTASVPGTGGKNGNYYKTVAGQNWFFPGVTPGGQFADVTIGIDYLIVNLQAIVAGVLAGLPKVPFTDFGLQLIRSAIYNYLALLSAAPYNFIVPDGTDPLRPITVTVPRASTLTPAQRTTRGITGISCSAGIQGAIQTAGVSIVLNP
jgi:hypothetical protein